MTASFRAGQNQVRPPATIQNNQQLRLNFTGYERFTQVTFTRRNTNITSGIDVYDAADVSTFTVTQQVVNNNTVFVVARQDLPRGFQAVPKEAEDEIPENAPLPLEARKGEPEVLLTVFQDEFTEVVAQ